MWSEWKTRQSDLKDDEEENKGDVRHLQQSSVNQEGAYQAGSSCRTWKPERCLHFRLHCWVWRNHYVEPGYFTMISQLMEIPVSPSESIRRGIRSGIVVQTLSLSVAKSPSKSICDEKRYNFYAVRIKCMMTLEKNQFQFCGCRTPTLFALPTSRPVCVCARHAVLNQGHVSIRHCCFRPT